MPPEGDGPRSATPRPAAHIEHFPRSPERVVAAGPQAVRRVLENSVVAEALKRDSDRARAGHDDLVGCGLVHLPRCSVLRSPGSDRRRLVHQPVGGVERVRPVVAACPTPRRGLGCVRRSGRSGSEHDPGARPWIAVLGAARRSSVPSCGHPDRSPIDGVGLTWVRSALADRCPCAVVAFYGLPWFGIVGSLPKSISDRRGVCSSLLWRLCSSTIF